MEEQSLYAAVNEAKAAVRAKDYAGLQRATEDMASLVPMANTLTRSLLKSGKKLIKAGEEFVAPAVTALRFAATHALKPKHEIETVAAWRKGLYAITDPEKRMEQILVATTRSIKGSRLRKAAHLEMSKNTPLVSEQMHRIVKKLSQDFCISELANNGQARETVEVIKKLGKENYSKILGARNAGWSLAMHGQAAAVIDLIKELHSEEQQALFAIPHFKRGLAINGQITEVLQIERSWQAAEMLVEVHPSHPEKTQQVTNAKNYEFG